MVPIRRIRGLLRESRESSELTTDSIASRSWLPTLLADIVLRGTVEAIGVLRSVVGVTTPLALSAALVGMRNVHFATRHWAAHTEPVGVAGDAHALGDNGID